MQIAVSYQSEKARIVRVIEGMASGKVVVEFDDASAFIRFKVRAQFLNTKLIENSGEWPPDELSRKSDDELRALIRNLSGGKI
jgi:hypothetical protein